MNKEISPLLSNPQSLMTFSNELKKFIVKQELFTNIQGKNYVNVEGWQFAGGSMGLFPVLESCDRLEREKEIAYKASVAIYSGDKIVSRGIAICSDRERGKSAKDEYVIASMSQTRAEGKAYRLLLGWLMKFAGYEGTPSEDMEWAIKKEDKKKGIEIDESIEKAPYCNLCNAKGIKIETKDGRKYWTCPENDLHRKNGEKFKMIQKQEQDENTKKFSEELDKI
jgi:hypothetical protein